MRRSLLDAGRLHPAIPAAVAAIAVLAGTLYVAGSYQLPYLPSLAIDASSSVLSPGGLSRQLDDVRDPVTRLTADERERKALTRLGSPRDRGHPATTGARAVAWRGAALDDRARVDQSRRSVSLTGRSTAKLTGYFRVPACIYERLIRSTSRGSVKVKSEHDGATESR